MAAATMVSISEKFIDKCDPDDPEYQRDLIRPVEIKEDVKLMEQRKRVSIILKSKTFCKELEDIIRRQCQNCGFSESSASLFSVNHISEQLLLAALPRKTTSAIGVGVSTNGIIPINDLRDGFMSYSRNERQLRCEVAALHRLMDMFSWCNGSQHCVTVRLAKDQDKFLIKPFGIFFHEVTASCLISIDSLGNVKDPGSTVLSADDSNWSFHAAIHTARPDIGCLIHLRTYPALCVSGSPQGLLPLSLEAVLLGDVATFVPKSDLSTSDSDSDFPDLGNKISEIFAPNRKILIVPNHGIFVGGSSVEEAWFLVQRVQTACEVQESLYKMELDELFLPEKEVQSEMIDYFQTSFETNGHQQQSEDEKISEKYLHKYRIGQMEFEAMMRHLDNSGYRTGYFYRQKDIYKNNYTESGLSPVSKYADVEIPPVCSSVVQNGDFYDDIVLTGLELNNQQSLSLQRGMSDPLPKQWFNTPNTYKIDNADTVYKSPIRLVSYTPEHRATRWISANPPEKASLIPHHPVTPGAHVAILSSASAASSAPVTPAKIALKGIDPRELKAKQKKVKDRYYFDTNTPGPQSCLLDGLTFEETRRVREEGMTKYLGKEKVHGDQPLITAASKGIVQRGHKDRAVVLEGVFKPANPFEKVTDDDLVKYREEIDRKNHPELYTDSEIVTSHSETDLITPFVAQTEQLMPPISSISLDDSVTNKIHSGKDTGMTSDSDFQADSSVALNSAGTAPLDTIPGAMTSETSAADLSHDDAEKDSRQDKSKKKKKSFKAFFGKKKKEKK